MALVPIPPPPCSVNRLNEIVNLPDDYLTTVTPESSKLPEVNTGQNADTSSPESGVYDGNGSYCPAEPLPVFSRGPEEGVVPEWMNYKPGSHITDSADFLLTPLNSFVDEKIGDDLFKSSPLHVRLPPEMGLSDINKSTPPWNGGKVNGIGTTQSKCPTEDYWKSNSSSGSNLADPTNISSPQRCSDNVRDKDMGKGFSEPSLEWGKLARSFELDIDEKGNKVSEHDDKRNDKPKQELRVSLSHGSLSKGSLTLVERPGGYVDVSTSTLDSSIPTPVELSTEILNRDLGFDTREMNGHDVESNQQPYISMEELKSLHGSSDKSLVKSVLRGHVEAAQKPYVSLDDLPKLMSSNSSVDGSASSLPVTKASHRKLENKPIFIRGRGAPSDRIIPTNPSKVSKLTSIPTPQENILGVPSLDSMRVLNRALSDSLPEENVSDVNVKKIDQKNKIRKKAKENNPKKQNSIPADEINNMKEKVFVPPNLTPIFRDYDNEENQKEEIKSKVLEIDTVDVPPNLKPTFAGVNDTEDYNNEVDNDPYCDTRNMINNISSSDGLSSPDDSPLYIGDNAVKRSDSEYCKASGLTYNSSLPDGGKVEGVLFHFPSVLENDDDSSVEDDYDNGGSDGETYDHDDEDAYVNTNLKSDLSVQGQMSSDLTHEHLENEVVLHGVSNDNDDDSYVSAQLLLNNQINYDVQ